MMNNCDCDNCTCDIDFSEDNGYKYVLDELKAIRAHVDETINLLEKRIEKDKIINEVLSTEYDDDEEEVIEERGIDFVEMIKAYDKALEIIKRDEEKISPTNWTHKISLPNRIWYTSNKSLYPYYTWY